MSPSDAGSLPPTPAESPAAAGAPAPDAAAPAAPPAAGPGVWARIGRVYASPFRAWEGLDTHARWWFPLLLVLVVQVGLLAATYHRALLPTMLESWNVQIERGKITPAQVDRFADFFGNNPLGMAVVIGQQAIAVPLLTLLVALVVWFGVGFVLGTRFKYRSSLEVVCWAGLVRLPEAVLTFVIAWIQESFKGIHFGLAALLPPEEAPTQLRAALEVLLDSVGPFNIWYLFVAIVGCSVLSGAPRKNVAWVLAGLYVALTVLFAVVAAVFGPGA